MFEKREGSSIGETRICPDTGEEFEVVWDGGPLLGPRPTRITDPTWTAPKRLYTRKPVEDRIAEERVKVVGIDDQVEDLDADYTIVRSDK